jgi:Protein of unknown function (DUF2442)
MKAKQHTTSRIDEGTFAKATARGKANLARLPVASSARYAAGRIHVELNNGCSFEFPVEMAEGLAGAKVADLRVIEVMGAGQGLYWPKLGADLFVPSLVRGILGTKQWMAQIGAAGGKAATEAKAAAARNNGKLGGRPSKSRELVVA